MDKSLIIIPANVPWEWPTDYVNQTAKYLSKKNQVICFFWLNAKSIKEHIQKSGSPIFFHRLNENISGYYSLNFLPFNRLKFVRDINIYINVMIVKFYAWWALRKYRYSRKICWFFDPISYNIVKHFIHKWTVIYDCIDYYLDNTVTADHENKLIMNTDYYFVNSHVLYDSHKTIRKAVIVPQGCSIDELQKNIKNNSIIPLKDKPIIGYIGGINYRLDYDLLYQLIQRNPQYYFVFVGPIQKLYGTQFQNNIRSKIWKLLRYPNCLYYPNQPKDVLSSIIRQFNICMIPYNISLLFNQNCFPMKLFEYFYMGKPVVSTPIEELKRYPKYVFFGSSGSEWGKHIKKILSKKWPVLYQKDQKILAINNSWENKVSEIYKHIDKY